MVAILLGLAVPSFTSVINGNRITSVVNELSAGIQYARVEAIRRNARVILCRSEDNATCDTSAGEWGGWISFVDANGDGDADTSELLRTATVSGTVEISASPAIAGEDNMIVIRPDGMARAEDRTLLNAQLLVCMPTTLPDENMRVLTLDAGSRLSVVSRDGAGACPAVADE